MRETPELFPRLALLLAALLLAGCQSGEAPPGASSREEFAELVSEAITAKDMEAMKRLYYWEGADEATHERIQKTIEGFFQGPIVATEYLPIAPGYSNEYIREGTLYRPNLPLDGHLRVRYGEPRTGPRTAVGIPFGQADGRFYFVTVLRTPVDTSDERNQPLALIVAGEHPDGFVGYDATCAFMVGDEEKEERFLSDRPSTRLFWGRHFTRCSVRKAREGGKIQFRLKEGDRVAFDSAAIEDDTPVTWILEAESDG